jgi:hypothetical protein
MDCSRLERRSRYLRCRACRRFESQGIRWAACDGTTYTPVCYMVICGPPKSPDCDYVTALAIMRKGPIKLACLLIYGARL